MKNLEKVLQKELAEVSNHFDEKLVAKGFFAALNACGVELNESLISTKTDLLEKQTFDIESILRRNTTTWLKEDVVKMLRESNLPQTNLMMRYIADSLHRINEAGTGIECMFQATCDIKKVEILRSEVTGKSDDSKETCSIYVTKEALQLFFRSKDIKLDTFDTIPADKTCGLYRYAISRNGFLGFADAVSCPRKRFINLLDQNIRCCDELFIDPEKKCININWETWFDVDMYFGTHTSDDEYAWVDFYTDWFPETDTLIGIYVVNTDNSSTEYGWELTVSEQKFLKEKVEAHCKEKYGCSLLDFWNQYDDAVKAAQRVERINAIKAFHEKQVAEKNAEKLTKEEEKAQLVRVVMASKARIDELLLIANECLKNGIEIDAYGKSLSRYKDTRENGSFITNGITHKIGFVKSMKASQITELGIDGGGCCGPWDFRTDGKNVYSVSNKGYAKGLVSEPTLEHLLQFVSGLSEFESAFYDYVDKITVADYEK